MKSRHAYLLLVIILSCRAFALAQESPAQKAPFSLTIKAPQTTVKLGSPIVLTLTLTNTSDRPLPYGGTELVDGVALRKIDIKVYDSDGKPVPETERGMAVHGRPRPHSGPPRPGPGGGPGTAVVDVKPGGTLQEQADLSKEFLLTQPGKYTVQAGRTDYPTPFRADDVLVKSNTITFTITP